VNNLRFGHILIKTPETPQIFDMHVRANELAGTNVMSGHLIRYGHTTTPEGLLMEIKQPQYDQFVLQAAGETGLLVESISSESLIPILKYN
jgi:hypothetical protein